MSWETKTKIKIVNEVKQQVIRHKILINSPEKLQDYTTFIRSYTFRLSDETVLGTEKIKKRMNTTK